MKKAASREHPRIADTVASDELGFCTCQDASSYFCLIKKMKLLLLLLLTFLVSFDVSSSTALPSESGSDIGYSSEWKILTKHNFSTQIRIHPHILLIVTLPWYGESRALMKSVTQAVNHWKSEFSSLKLMFMYRNIDKVLADAIGARDDITILYFHHSNSFKYHGRLRAQNILSSVHPYLLVPPGDVPLKLLNTPQELQSFLDSTDKAFLLLDFCGWTLQLQHKEKKNATKQGFGAQGDSGFNGNPFPTSSIQNKDQKWTHSSMQCSIRGDINGIPWLGESRSVSDDVSWSSKESGLDSGYPCSLQEFPSFESFFSTFMTVARDLFLPPERHRFGLVVQRSLLSSLGIEEPISWSVLVHHAGCPGCAKMLKGVDDFNRFLQTEKSIVYELEATGHAEKPVLLANKPSMLLFVDRSSESPEDRVKSVEALAALRKLAWNSQITDHVSPGKLGHFSILSHQHQRSRSSRSRHPNLKLSESSRMVKAKTKMSIMSITDGKEKHVTLETDINKNALGDILGYLLQQKGEGKLSLLAKKAGFQLLSNDLEVKTAGTSLGEGDQHIQSSLEISQENDRNVVHQDEKQLLHEPPVSSIQDENTFSTMEEKLSKLGDPDPSQYDGGGRISLARSEKFAEPGQLTTTRGLSDLKDFLPERSYSSKLEELREKRQIEGFNVTFLFSDGDYRLLRTLTGDSKIPSLLIIDPIQQQHYIYPKNKNFNFDSQAQFLRDYIDVNILPYQHSESVLPISREGSHPPFVNLDFHEVDSIPKITGRSLSELISGVNHSWGKTAPALWQKDVFVLFSSNWCGFCQRMELVVREVYRALKGYVNFLKTRSQNDELSLGDDRFQDISSKIPVIYLLDCTFNDCSLIFKAINKEEIYPSLMLFPEGNKSPVTYKGERTVSSIINFMADHGKNLHHLISENGILWTKTEKRCSSKTYINDVMTDHVVIPRADRFCRVLTNELPEKIFKDTNGSESYYSKSVEEFESAPHVVVGSILVATEKLVGAHPFDGSMILIIKADRDTGFQGIIFNKQISWKSLGELEEGSEALREAKLSLGGPLVMHEFPLMALTRRPVKDKSLEVLPGIYFVDQLRTVAVIDEVKSGATESVIDYWFFLGYASWGWGQLFDEINEGTWIVSKEDTGKLLEWPSY
ncbi:hypothetical protein SAY86_030728 [Trapa natans]|uniref:Thioredoxin domain-containing protein n=1 Tax=Trapa natans TaxID=22666 RepID=A0AAN7M5G1_TRANT|nr:hypothetical protein SAY86_030728 [Trapa natans]